MTRTLLIATTLALASGAALAQVGARFEVTSFTATASAGTLTWLSASDYQTQAVEAAEAGGLGGNDWDSATLFALQDRALAASVAHAAAGSTAGADGRIAGSATAWASLVDATANPHVGSAMAQQSREFSLSEAGTVTFSVDYVVSVSAPLGDAMDSYAQSALDFSAGGYGNGSGGASMAELFSFEQPGGTGSRSGSFMLQVTLDGPGDLGWYNLRGNAWTSATAAVPEPGSWALMLLGLGGLGAAARRRAC